MMKYQLLFLEFGLLDPSCWEVTKIDSHNYQYDNGKVAR